MMIRIFNYRQTGDNIDLPSEYIKIETCRVGISYNYNMTLFGRKQGNEYHYQLGYGFKLDDQTFIQDVTKEDFSLYEIGDPILYADELYYRDSWLRHLRDDV